MSFGGAGEAVIGAYLTGEGLEGEVEPIRTLI